MGPYAEQVLDALGDPTRRAVFKRLRAGARSVGELAAGMDVSRPAVSQHLRVLKDARLVADRAAGTRRRYTVDTWGSVLVWQPCSRLVLSYDITADWRYDPNLKTELEIRFLAEGANLTRVELEHRCLDRYGERREQMRRVFDTEGDWGKLLDLFAR